MELSPLEILKEALERHGRSKDAAAALAAEPDRLTVRWRSFLQDHKAEVLDRHRPALGCLEALHIASLAVGLAFEEEHVPDARQIDEPRVKVLRQLWGSSLEAAGEIILLLRGGYPAGATARWRLVREAEVIALF